MALSTNDVWAVGYEGRIYHYNGANWSVYDSFPDIWMIWDMDVSAEGHLWACGYEYGGTESYILTTMPVPEPSVILIGLNGLLCIVFSLRTLRKRV